jgi:hypothetical protein
MNYKVRIEAQGTQANIYYNVEVEARSKADAGKKAKESDAFAI